MIAQSDTVIVAEIAAIASVVVGLFTLLGVAISARRTKTASRQVVENNGWAKANFKTLEAMLAEFHELRGEFRQWRKDHEDQHASKRRTK